MHGGAAERLFYIANPVSSISLRSFFLIVVILFHSYIQEVQFIICFNFMSEFYIRLLLIEIVKKKRNMIDCVLGGA